MTTRPHVAVISASLSGNALGRATSMAALCQEWASVEVLGPRARHLWAAETSRIAIRGVRRFGTKAVIAELNRRHERGDHVAVWISKCFPFSSRVLRYLNREIPVVVDFDDHDVALAEEFRSASWLNRMRLHAWREGSPVRVARSQSRALLRSFAVTVSSRALARELLLPSSAIRVPHARPQMNANRGTASGIRKIGFLGTMRPHKGFEEIVNALDGDPKLEVITFAQRDIAPPSRQRSRWTFIDPATPLSKAYDLVDVSVLPMSNSIGSRFQLPAKAIDAAATGTPIAATTTPVLSEYFGSALIAVDDWSGLGAQLRDTDVASYSDRLSKIWREELSTEVVAVNVRSTFEQLWAD